MGSEALAPFGRWVQFHSTADDGETGLAFPALVVHENANEELDLWVFCHDSRNSAGLSDGMNWRPNIGRGGPGQDASWSYQGES